MRKIYISRRNQFRGCLVKYDCFFNVDYDDFEKYLSEFYARCENDEDEGRFFDFEHEVKERFLLEPTVKHLYISNRKTIEFEIPEEEGELFIFNGALSNLQIVKAGNSDISFFVKTVGGWMTPPKLLIYTQ